MSTIESKIKITLLGALYVVFDLSKCFFLEF